MMAESEEAMGPMDGAEAAEAEADDVETSQMGIHLLLNNKFDEAFALFERQKNDSPLMHAGYSFVFFMQALMSFEEEKKDEALKILQETEKKCELGDGFVKSIKKKFSKKKKKDVQLVSVEDKLQRQVIVADSLLYQAILVFTGQDIPSYIKGGWYLRKAWKLYEKLYKEVCGLREKQAGKLKQSASQDSIQSASSDSAIDGNDNETPPEILERLQGAVSFGYGTFQVCISMIPPKILKIIEFLGFEGDRHLGLKALVYANNSKDMKAPLATLGLLWYHTVLRPFFALDGANEYAAGCVEAEALIADKTDEFPNSSLFFFFQGRIHRLRKETETSLSLYNQALESATGQKEIELMCMYEIGWVNLLKLKWRDSLCCFTKLKQETKWSKCYYSYLEAVCLGAMGDVKGAIELFKEVPKLQKKKNDQIEAFCARRGEKVKKNGLTQEYCRLLTLELIFLWHALPTCTAEELRPFLDVCDMQTDIKTFHLRCLLEGAVFKELGEETYAMQCLEESLARHQGMKDDMHVPAFTMFEMASIHMKNPQTVPKAKQLLQQIKENHKDFDFENRLAVRVNNSLRQLKIQASG